MSATRLTSPFDSESIEEIHLARAPLVRVLAQVRFPRLTALENPATITQFATEVAEEYPLIDEGREISLLVNSEGVAQQQQQSSLWRLRSADEKWTVTLAPAFLSIETSQYNGRKDFISRFQRLISPFATAARPPFIERLGVRFTNRIDQPEILAELQSLLKGDAMGALAIPIAPGVVRGHALTDALFHFDDRSLQARWGFLPAGAVLDPTLPPVDTENWILDLDSFTTKRSSFDSDSLSAQAHILAEQAYGMFRWLVTERFLETFKDPS